MLKNYIKIALRNLVRHKGYSFINIAGLTLGITCCSLLFLYVLDELNYDGMHEKKDRIFRIVEHMSSEEGNRQFGQTAPAAGPTLAAEYEETESFVRLFKFGGHINFTMGDTKFAERAYYYADSSFFQVFDFGLLHGEPKTALANPNSIIMDAEWAKTLFGTEDVVGKQIELDDGESFLITGVMESMPQNSHIQARMLLSVPYSDERFKGYVANWSAHGAYTYLVLDDKAAAAGFSEKLPAFAARYFKDEPGRKIVLQPLADIHFGSQNIEYSLEDVKGQQAYIYVFVAVGIFMLLIACINYINLATAKSLHRGREIGIRKVSGAQRYQLIFQFLAESALIAFFALALAVGLMDLLLPYFNDITGKHFVFADAMGEIFAILFIVTLLIGLISGIYPALMMSAMRPALILKGTLNSGRKSASLRKALVITQFALSIAMIIATIVTGSQMNYIQNLSLGFEKDQLMVVDINSGDVRQRFEAMKTELTNSPYVKGVAVSSRVPGEWKNLEEVYVRAVQAASEDSTRVSFIGFDEDMLDVYGIQLAEGEDFSGNPTSDSLHVLLNQTAVKLLGLSDPIGQYVRIDGGSFKVAGVVRDFNFQSLHNKIAPLIIGYRLNPFQQIDYFSIKFDPAHTQEAIAHATRVHDQFDQYTPIEYHFLDQQWELFYESEKRAGIIFATGAGITIFIACMGLFGLASFVIQKRTKEIGVRKIHGASAGSLFLLLSRTFAAQVLVAFLIAAPLSWYYMNQWLSNFAFRFEMGIAEIAVGGAVALIIALLSISYRVLKAAMLNPAHTLRSE